MPAAIWISKILIINIRGDSFTLDINSQEYSTLSEGVFGGSVLHVFNREFTIRINKV